ncbi:hypothetical protein GCM10010431_67140 [Streptomyces kunmingensis]
MTERVNHPLADPSAGAETFLPLGNKGGNCQAGAPAIAGRFGTWSGWRIATLWGPDDAGMAGAHVFPVAILFRGS